MPHPPKPSVLALLRETYGAINIPAVAAGKEIGLAEKTTRNMLCEGRFPLRTRKISSKTVVSIFELAAFLEGGTPSQIGSVGAERPKRERGRPTKASKFQSGDGGAR